MTTYRIATEDDLPLMQRALALAFATDEDGVATWLRNAGLDKVRLLEVDGEIAGTALLAPMGQYFGGVSVPMTGVAAVTILPHMRGRGLARDLMRRCIEEIRDAGVPLSVLYASTQALYHTVGYEQAGHLSVVRLPLKSIHVTRGAAARSVNDDDRDAVADCYRRSVTHLDGYLDRRDYLWQRVYAPKGSAAKGYAIDGPRGVDAYTFFTQKDNLPDGRHNLHLTDLQCATPEAARSILAFLAGFSSMAHDAVFYAGPVMPLLTLLPEQHYSVERREYWMLRITDVPGALTARAYSRTCNATIHLDITDDMVKGNAGRCVVHVEDGRATVEPGGDGSAKLDIRALASIYTGFLPPHSLAILGLIKAPSQDLDALTSIFAGPTPAMADMF